MSLFGKKQPEVPTNFLEDEAAAEAAGVDHNSVLDYLLQLKSEDYDKLLKLTEIYRHANKQAGELIPAYDPDRAETVEVQQFGKAEDIKVRTGRLAEDEIDQMLDDELAAAFIEDDHESAASRKQREAAEKTKVNVAKKN